MVSGDNFLANVSFLMKKKKLRIGEFEEKIGVSTGYISRLAKKNGMLPPLDIADKIAHELGVTLDVLLRCDLSQKTDDEQYRLNLLSALATKTDLRIIHWNKMVPLVIKRVMNGSLSQLPMLEVVPGQGEFYNDFGDVEEEYNSYYLGNELMLETDGYPPKPWFNCTLDEHNTVYLTHMYILDEDEVRDVYELYLRTSERHGDPEFEDTWTDYHNTPLCCSMTMGEDTGAAIVSLYKTVENHQNDIKIPECAKNVLENIIMK